MTGEFIFHVIFNKMINILNFFFVNVYNSTFVKKNILLTQTYDIRRQEYIVYVCFCDIQVCIHIWVDILYFYVFHIYFHDEDRFYMTHPNKDSGTVRKFR